MYHALKSCQKKNLSQMVNISYTEFFTKSVDHDMPVNVTDGRCSQLIMYCNKCVQNSITLALVHSEKKT